MKKSVGLFFLMVVVLTSVACGSKNEDLIGNWNLYEAETMGIDIVMVITQDQIGLLDNFYDYTIKDDKIIIVKDGVKTEADFNVDGDTLTFVYGDEKQTYIRKKD